MPETDNWEDDGTRVRGESIELSDRNQPDPTIFPALQVHFAWGRSDYLIDIAEIGGTDRSGNGFVEVTREEIPRLVEALVERSRPEDADRIRRGVERALEDIEE